MAGDIVPGRPIPGPNQLLIGGVCLWTDSEGKPHGKALGPTDTDPVDFSNAFAAPTTEGGYNVSCLIGSGSNNMIFHEIVTYPVLTDAQMLEARAKLLARCSRIGLQTASCIRT